MLPVETTLALFPEGRTVKRRWPRRAIRLNPVSLAHAAAMEVLGCPIGVWHSEAKLLVAAWLLSQPTEAMRDAIKLGTGAPKGWFSRIKGCAREVANAASELMAAAALTYVPPKQEGGAPVMNDGLAHGYGWPLEVAEALSSEYGMKFDEALAMDTGRALALLSVRRGRNDAAGGPDYYDRIRLERWKRAGVIGHPKEA